MNFSLSLILRKQIEDGGLGGGGWYLPKVAPAENCDQLEVLQTQRPSAGSEGNNIKQI